MLEVCLCVWMLAHPEFGSCIDALILYAEVVTCSHPGAMALKRM